VRVATLLLVLAPGCLYVDPINQPPSADIVQDSSAPVFRGDPVALTANTSDPDGQPVTVRWRIYACTDATSPAGCDRDPFFIGATERIETATPTTRAGGEPVAALRVILEATDSLGATAKPAQELLIPVSDHGPTLTLAKDSSYGYVVGTPIDVYAKVTDPDDDPPYHLAWQVFGPAAADAFDDLAVPTDPTQAGKRLVVSTPGDWDVRVTVLDHPGGLSAMADQPITVVPDHPPCLTSWTPLDAPPGQTVPLTDPTLFQVLAVTDDLDPYPAVVGDPLRGTPSFSWSILPPGASQRDTLAGVIGNSVALDPAAYSPGDVLELRVEIEDRVHTPIACADADPTCSVISDPTCIQRLTWRVEVQ
jgi:hypothetical protein